MGKNNHPEASQVHQYQVATGSTQYTYRLTPNSSIPEAGWNSEEYAVILFMAEAASIHSDPATQT